MHILHIFNEINFSGAEIMYANAAGLFQQKGYKLTAVGTGMKAGNYVHQFEKSGINIIHLPFPKGFKKPFLVVGYMRNIYSLIKRSNIDVLHVHRSDVFLYFSICAALAGKKTIMTTHNVFRNRTLTWPKAWLERLCARKLFRTTFQTIGESVYNNELTYYKNPSVRVNNWYNARRFFPPLPNEKNISRENLNIRREAFVVISTGSCSEIKNHAAIIKAMAIVVPQFPCIYLHLGSGHLETEEKKQALELGLANNIRFLGNKENVRDYLIAADVFIMSSKFEGLSIAAIESMACKLPSILYRSPGLTDLIKNDDNGFLIEHDPVQIAEKIIHFKNNPMSAAEKGNRAFDFVSANFNMESGVGQIIKLYGN
ncbi:MAG: glycosyltransferase family 4 protein [Bacteroidota bacterium]